MLRIVSERFELHDQEMIGNDQEKDHVMLNISEIATATEERVLTGVKVGHAVAIDGLKNAVALADRVVPERVSAPIADRAQSLPAPGPIVSSAFGFASKLLDAQREFASEVIDVLAPKADEDVTEEPAAKATKATKATATKAKAAKTTKAKAAKATKATKAK